MPLSICSPWQAKNNNNTITNNKWKIQKRQLVIQFFTKDDNNSVFCSTVYFCTENVKKTKTNIQQIFNIHWPGLQKIEQTSKNRKKWEWHIVTNQHTEQRCEIQTNIVLREPWHCKWNRTNSIITCGVGDKQQQRQQLETHWYTGLVKDIYYWCSLTANTDSEVRGWFTVLQPFGELRRNSSSPSHPTVSQTRILELFCITHKWGVRAE